MAFNSFCDELMKTSMALSDKERDLFRQSVSRQQQFDQASAKGSLDEAGQKAMRDNVERIKAFRAKSKDDNAKIPAWAMDPEGMPPTAGGSFVNPEVENFIANFATKHPNVASGIFGVGVGAATGLAGGLSSHAMGAILKRISTPEELKENEDGAHEGLGPMNRYIVDNPIKGQMLRNSALTGLGFAMAQPGTQLGQQLASKINPKYKAVGGGIGNIAALLAPYAAYSMADSALAKREQSKQEAA